MDQGPLVSEQITAGARFLGAFDKYRPVQAAFWLKDDDTGAWSLYVMSDQITDDNFDVAYGEVVQVAGAIRDPWFDIMQVKVIGEEDPLTKAVRDLQQRYPGRNSIRLHGTMFGGVWATEVYIYPSPIPVPAS
jgi:hypothetical protein